MRIFSRAVKKIRWHLSSMTTSAATPAPSEWPVTTNLYPCALPHQISTTIKDALPSNTMLAEPPGSRS
eukprot:1895499-Amphidinium_carterae.1